MKEVEIVIRAFKAEAQLKPNDKIFLGKNSYTFTEFAELLNGFKMLSKEERKLIKGHLDKTLKRFREDKNFRLRVMTLAGVLT